MIKVYHGSNSIILSGHAGYGGYGQDIVCAAVSALVQTLIAAIEELTEDKIIYEIRPGNTYVHYGNLSEQGRLLIDSFFIGLGMIAEAYPDSVRII